MSAAVLLLAAGAARPTGLAAQTIDTIIIQRRDIFGPRSGAPPLVARVGDALHMLTRERTIRRTLLVDPGDPYDSARVAEAERDLRRLGIFRDVRVDTTRVAGALALRVRTADGWSTKPQLEFRSSAGDVTWQAGIVEENLLGTATVFGAIYGRTPDRDFLTLDYSNRSVFARRARLDLGFARLTDGKVGSWRYGMPFTETSSRRALLTYGWVADQRLLLFRAGGLDTTVRRNAYVVGVFGGLATWASSTSYRRFWVRAAARREEYGPDTAGALLPGSVTGHVAVGFETGRARWLVREHLDTYGRREDVDISPRLGVAVAALPTVLGYTPDRAGAGFELGGHTGLAAGRVFAAIGASTHGVLTGDGLDSARASATAVLVGQTRRQTVILRADGFAARRIQPGGEYDLWGQRIGPRLFGAHAYTGTRAWAATLEDRLLVANEVAGLLAVGLAGFVDAGGAWFAGDPSRWGGNAGLALRLGATRASAGEVFEVAVGWRWSNDDTVAGWAFSFGTAYRLATR